MEYLLLIYAEEKGWASLDEATQSTEIGKCLIFGKEFAEHIKGSNSLQPTTTATTVRIRNGKRLTTDGPFAETKEQLAGYYILDCAHLDEALEWAAKIPTGCGGVTGCVEVRPIHEFPKGPQGEPILAGRG